MFHAERSEAERGEDSSIFARRAFSMKKRTHAAPEPHPGKRSLQGGLEADFPRGLRPHRYASLQSSFKNLVFIEPQLYDLFGSSEAINEALRFLAKVAKQRGGSAQGPKTRSSSPQQSRIRRTAA